MIIKGIRSRPSWLGPAGVDVQRERSTLRVETSVVVGDWRETRRILGCRVILQEIRKPYCPNHESTALGRSAELSDPL